MKKSLLSLVAGVLVLVFNGCKKEEDNSPLSAKIEDIVSESLLNDLRARGLVINEGTTPPAVEGIYQVTPYRLLSPFGPKDSYAKGRIIDDYKYRFYDQLNDDVKLDFKSTGSDRATGVASFLAGNGSKFSLFGEQTGTYSGVSYKIVSVISGEVTATGIGGFQIAVVVTEKGPDPGNVMLAVGQGRIWEDGNGLADKITSYRLSADASAEGARLDNALINLLRSK